VIRCRRSHLKELAVVGLLLTGGLLAVGCVVTYSEGEDLRGNAGRASATVTAVHRGRATTWDLVFPDVGGLPQTVGGVENLKGEPKVGARIEVYYSLTDPANADEVTDVRFGAPGNYQVPSAEKLGLFALIPLAAGLYGAGHLSQGAGAAPGEAAGRGRFRDY
jgi:hypothetical protein